MMPIVSVMDPFKCKELALRERRQSLLEKLDNLRNNKLLTDITLVVNGELFLAHRLLLAANSAYFRDVFKQKPKINRIVIKDIEADVFAAVLQCFYTGRLRGPAAMNPVKIAAVLTALRNLKAVNYKKISSQCVVSTLSVETFYDLWKSAKQLNHKAAERDIAGYVAKNIEVCSERDSFGQLTLAELISVMSSSCLRKMPPYVVIDAVLTWCEFQPEKRHKYLPSVLAVVGLKYCYDECKGLFRNSTLSNEDWKAINSSIKMKISSQTGSCSKLTDTSIVSPDGNTSFKNCGFENRQEHLSRNSAFTPLLSNSTCRKLSYNQEFQSEPLPSEELALKGVKNKYERNSTFNPDTTVEFCSKYPTLSTNSDANFDVWSMGINSISTSCSPLPFTPKTARPSGQKELMAADVPRLHKSNSQQIFIANGSKRKKSHDDLCSSAAIDEGKNSMSLYHKRNISSVHSLRLGLDSSQLQDICDFVSPHASISDVQSISLSEQTRKPNPRYVRKTIVNDSLVRDQCRDHQEVAGGVHNYNYAHSTRHNYHRSHSTYTKQDPEDICCKINSPCFNIVFIGQDDKSLPTQTIYNYQRHQWQAVQPLLEVPGCSKNAALYLHKDCLYCFGGELSVRKPVNFASVRPLDSTSFSKISSMCVARSNAGAVHSKDDIFVIGGFNGDGEVLADVEKYNPGENRWQTLPSLLYARCNPSLSATGMGLFVVSGFLDEYNFQVCFSCELFSFSISQWVEICTMPTSICLLPTAITAIDDRIFLIRPVKPNKIYQYVSSTDEWRLVSQCNNADIQVVSLLSVGGQLWVLDDRKCILKFNFQSEAWEFVTRLPESLVPPVSVFVCSF